MIISKGFEFKKKNWAVGETDIVVQVNIEETQVVIWNYENDSEFVELLLINNALRNLRSRIQNLIIPYFPYSRQDRITQPGQAFSLKTACELINSLQCDNVRTMDPHSDVIAALVKNLDIVPQHHYFLPYLKDLKDFVLVCPDAGAIKKIQKMSELLGNYHTIIYFNKHRDEKTGNPCIFCANEANLCAKDCYIIDDICDGGRTFIEIARQLNNMNCGEINLMVTHGFFTNGLEVFKGMIDNIYTRGGLVNK